MAVSGYAIVGLALSLFIEAIVPPCAVAQVRATQLASGSVQIENTVATGVAFNVATQTVTSLFVAGQLGDTVSLSAIDPMAGLSTLTPSNAAPLLSSLNVAAPTEAAAVANLARSSDLRAADMRIGDITVLAKGVVSIALRPLEGLNVSLNSRARTFVVLAQFN